MAQPVATPRARMAIIVTSTVLGGVLAAGAVIGSEMLETPLESAARSALQSAGYTSVAVRFDGREGFISSSTATKDELARAEGVVERLDGVRWVTIVDDVDAGAGSGGAGDTTPTPSPDPTPTPTPTPTPSAAELATISNADILFAPDSVALTPTADATLASIAAVLQRYPDLRVELTGHIAIPTGTPADAIAFSAARAQVAVDRLVALGVEPGRLTIVGAGTSDAVGDNSTAAGAASNRRVTFTILGGP